MLLSQNDEKEDKMRIIPA